MAGEPEETGESAGNSSGYDIIISYSQPEQPSYSIDFYEQAAMQRSLDELRLANDELNRLVEHEKSLACYRDIYEISSEDRAQMERAAEESRRENEEFTRLVEFEEAGWKGYYSMGFGNNEFENAQLAREAEECRREAEELQRLHRQEEAGWKGFHQFWKYRPDADPPPAPASPSVYPLQESANSRKKKSSAKAEYQGPSEQKSYSPSHELSGGGTAPPYIAHASPKREKARKGAKKSKPSGMKRKKIQKKRGKSSKPKPPEPAPQALPSYPQQPQHSYSSPEALEALSQRPIRRSGSYFYKSLLAAGAMLALIVGALAWPSRKEEPAAAHQKNPTTLYSADIYGSDGRRYTHITTDRYAWENWKSFDGFGDFRHEAGKGKVVYVEECGGRRQLTASREQWEENKRRNQEAYERRVQLYGDKARDDTKFYEMKIEE